jgi:predicted dehydrogenase
VLRLGFLGLGWIGRHRMQAMLDSGLAQAVAIADPDPLAVQSAAALAPTAARGAGLADVLAERPDGVVIATPSALHAGQTVAALRAGTAVFCQKPLGRSRPEVRAAIEAAEAADRLLAVDLSYCHTAAFRAVQGLVAAGTLGQVFAADLTFHNAYGPDRPWFRDRALSGGGCVIDLGTHLIDMALHLLDWPEVTDVQSCLHALGLPVTPGDTHAVEDHAVVTLMLATGAVVRVACSWNLPAGQDAVIAADIHGTRGGAAVRNVAGSFHDLTAFHHRGTAREVLAEPPDDWGGRAGVDWLRRLAGGAGFDPQVRRLERVAAVIDRIYGPQTLSQPEFA